MTIEIKIIADSAIAARAEMAALLGAQEVAPGGETGNSFFGGASYVIAPDGTAEMEPVAEAAEEPVSAVESAIPAVRGRLYGSPERPRVRRTKVETAEDAEIARLATLAGVDPATLVNTEASVALARFATSEPKPLISTGEERIDPSNPEDAAQDAEDERAETQATAGEALTHDDLRNAVGAFAKLVGIEQSIARVPEILGCAIVDVPVESLAEAIRKINEAGAGSTPEAAPAPVLEPFKATKNDVIEAMVGYGKKYDGADKQPGDMVNMIADRAKILVAEFGEGVDGLSKIADDPIAYGRAVMALRVATETNPFGRGVV